jgi:nucleotide-binding universal stress UspA family protein
MTTRPAIGGQTVLDGPVAARHLALVATDGSESAIEAARTALEVLRPDIEITLVTVVPPEYDPNQDAGGFEGPVMSDEQAHEEHLADVAGAAGALAATAKATRPELHSEMITADGRAADALVRLAAEREAAVLVVGHEPHGLLHELFTGSVAERIVRRAHCPVLVVPVAKPD